MGDAGEAAALAGPAVAGGGVQPLLPTAHAGSAAVSGTIWPACCCTAGAASASCAGCAAPAGRIKGTAMSNHNLPGHTACRCCCQRETQPTLMWVPPGVAFSGLAFSQRGHWADDTGGWRASPMLFSSKPLQGQRQTRRHSRPSPRSRPAAADHMPKRQCQGSLLRPPGNRLSTHQQAHWWRQAALQRPWPRSSSWLEKQQGRVRARTRPLPAVIRRSRAYWQPVCAQNLVPGLCSVGPMGRDRRKQARAVATSAGRGGRAREGNGGANGALLAADQPATDAPSAGQLQLDPSREWCLLLAGQTLTQAAFVHAAFPCLPCSL